MLEKETVEKIVNEYLKKNDVNRYRALVQKLGLRK